MSVELILGCMFSGKTTELIRRCSRYQAIGKNILMINHSYDTRNEGSVVQTHQKFTMRAVKTEDILSILDSPEYQEADVIGIDESQFFTNLKEFVKFASDRDNKRIIVAGLDGDCQRERFGEIIDLVPLCENIVKLNAVCSICKDGSLASFSKRLDENNTQQTVVGGSESYIAVCRKHL